MNTCKTCSGSGTASAHPDSITPCPECVDGVVGWVIIGSHYIEGDMVLLACDDNGTLVFDTKEWAEEVAPEVAEDHEFCDWKVISTDHYQHTQSAVRSVLKHLLFGESE
jgi:hypothetical protein